MTANQSEQNDRKRRLKAIAKGLIFIASLAAVAVLVRWSGLEHLLDTAWIDKEIKGQGVWGIAFFIFITALATGAGLPRQIPSFLGGYAFGSIAGTLWGVLGTGLGCFFAFLWARFLARSFVAHRFEGKIRKVDNFLSHAPFSMALIIRLMPVGNNLITNLLAGVSSVGLWRFLLGSMVGYIPQTLVFALVGSGVRVDQNTKVIMGIVLFVLSTWWGFSLFRKYRADSLLK